ncbi:MAG: S41 family peptidase [Spirochaetia bacterium]|nr:S41 family peptidase [Spirochaetia bacterium]
MRKKILAISFLMLLVLSQTALISSSWLPAESTIDSAEKDTIDETMEKLESLYRLVDSVFLFDIDYDAVYDSMAKGLFSALEDPYSEYITAEESQDIQDLTQGIYGGIGAYISKPNPSYIDYYDPETYMVTIVAPFLGSPAYKAGLHAGDLIAEIDGVAVDEYTAQEASAKLRGEPGTVVELLVVRGSTSFTLSVERAIVEIPTVRYDVIDDIGYLQILEFTPITPEKVREAISYFETRNYSGIIMDLRGNPGGSVDSAVQIADLFLSLKTVLIMESGEGKKSSNYRTRFGTNVPPEIPLVVLTNGGTASSSEILAGALRDNDRAVLIGETTFGKGLVQNVYPYDKDFFKITSAQYLTPDGNNIHKIGIVPDIEDIEPELSEEELDSFVLLQEEKRIKQFVETQPSFIDSEVNNYISELQNEGINLNQRLLRKLIRNEFENTMDFPPIYDLEYDLVLRRTLEYIKTGEYNYDKNSAD